LDEFGNLQNVYGLYLCIVKPTVQVQFNGP